MEDLIGAVSLSVQRAQNALEQAAADQYLSYFERPLVADGADSAPPQALSPRTLRLTLPGEEREAEVPLLALVSHNTLCLDRVDVRLNLAPAIAEENGSLDVTAGPPCGDGHAVELVFRCAIPNEAMARISDSAYKML